MNDYSYSWLRRLSLVAFVVWLQVITPNTISQSVVSIPIVLYNNQDQTNTTFVFEYDFTHPHTRLEFAVVSFCEKHNIQGTFCRQLFLAAQERINEVKSEYYRSIKLNPQLPISDELPDSRQYGLIRVSGAVQALIDFDQPGIRQELMDQYQSALYIVHNILRNHFSRVFSRREIKILVFIHSTLLTNNQTPQILYSILNSFHQSSIDRATSLIIVCHYGLPLPMSLTDLFPDVLFLPIAKETSLFELPTLSLMQSLFNDTSLINPGMHVLYMHTMGQSYQLAYPQINNWRDMLLYFLVDNHQSCYHLLESTLFDVIGVSFVNNPNRLSGNFWWSTAKHIASLPALYYLYSQRVDMEAWILSKSRTRVYMFHNTNINHHEAVYPWYCYRPAMTESEQQEQEQQINLDDWRTVCNDYDEVRYQQLHGVGSAASKGSASSSLCLALEI